MTMSYFAPIPYTQGIFVHCGVSFAHGILCHAGISCVFLYFCGLLGRGRDRGGGAGREGNGERRGLGFGVIEEWVPEGIGSVSDRDLEGGRGGGDLSRGTIGFAKCVA